MLLVAHNMQSCDMWWWINDWLHHGGCGSNIICTAVIGEVFSGSSALSARIHAATSARRAAALLIWINISQAIFTFWRSRAIPGNWNAFAFCWYRHWLPCCVTSNTLPKPGFLMLHWDEAPSVAFLCPKHFLRPHAFYTACTWWERTCQIWYIVLPTAWNQLHQVAVAVISKSVSNPLLLSFITVSYSLFLSAAQKLFNLKVAIKYRARINAFPVLISVSSQIQYEHLLLINVWMRPSIIESIRPTNAVIELCLCMK